MQSITIEDTREWLIQRRITVCLAIFFIGWFGIQQLIHHRYGLEVVSWWFYFEQPPDHRSPGNLFSAISHDVQDISHITTNVALLLIAGAIAEPKIGGRKVLTLVILIGLIGTQIANLSSPIFQVWVTAGASGGILTLLAYTGLACRRMAIEYINGESGPVRNNIERTVIVLMIVSIPLIPAVEIYFYGHLNSGHTMGLLLGVIAYSLDRNSS